MKKGIITTLVVTICMMLTATYAFAASSKTEKKEVKKEVTTTEKQKETTTAEKPKTETKESEEPNIEETEISTEEEVISKMQKRFRTIRKNQMIQKKRLMMKKWIIVITNGFKLVMLLIQIFKQVMRSSRSVKSVIYVKVLKFPKKNLKKPRKKTKSLMLMKAVNMRIVKMQR